MSTTVTYKGNTIATVNNNTKTLKTAGKYLEDDVTLVDVSGGASAISVIDELDEHGGTIRHINAVDLSNDTVTAAHLEYGYTAHDSQGEAITGTLVPGGGGTYQAKTGINPSTSSQTITADAGYDALSSVQINAMPGGSVTAPSTISGTAATVSTGTNTLTLTKTVSVTPNVTTAGYISSGTAGNASVSLQASVTTQAAQTIHPSTADQSIAASRYLTGAQTFKGVTTTNLTAENIKSGVTVQIGDSTDSDCVASVIGTYAGSGGVGTLLATLSMGTISTSSTTAADTGKSISVSNVNNYDLLVVETSVDSVTNNRHTATVGLIFLTASSTVGTKNGTNVATVKWNSRVSSNGTTTTRAGTTAYGIYPNSCSVATSNGITTATIPMYQRYNSTSTGTINGAYTARVYGVNLYDLIGG